MMLIAGILAADGKTHEGWLQVRGERVVASGRGAAPGAPDLVHEGIIAPGLCDLHVNGAAGVEVVGGPVALDRIDATMLAHGVTSYLPTVVSTDPATAARALDDIGERVRDPASPVEGAHLEGPFINLAFRGVHRPEFLLPPDGSLPEYIKHPAVRLVTLAPDLPGAHGLIEILTRRGVIVSMGHSGATFEDAARGAAAGARAVTHLFNAMPSLHHREPGIAGEALLDDRLSLGLIADGYHVDRHMLALVARLAADRVILVTDASPAAGAPPGRYELAGFIMEGTSEGRSQTLDGQLAGSMLLLDEAVHRWRDAAELPLVAALQAATQRPAKIIGLQADLSPGSFADLVLLTAEGQVERVMRRGRWVR